MLSGITLFRCYDGGVERFDDDGRPEYREGSAGDGGKAELTEWLRSKAGVLVTSEPHFRGCEADTMITCLTSETISSLQAQSQHSPEMQFVL